MLWNVVDIVFLLSNQRQHIQLPGEEQEQDTGVYGGKHRRDLAEREKGAGGIGPCICIISAFTQPVIFALVRPFILIQSDYSGLEDAVLYILFYAMLCYFRMKSPDYLHRKLGQMNKTIER